MKHCAALDVILVAVRPSLPPSVFDRLPTYSALLVIADALRVSAPVEEKEQIGEQCRALAKLTQGIRDVDEAQLTLFPNEAEGPCK